eukprot:gene2675-2920_t
MLGLQERLAVLLAFCFLSGQSWKWIAVRPAPTNLRSLASNRVMHSPAVLPLRRNAVLKKGVYMSTTDAETITEASQTPLVATPLPKHPNLVEGRLENGFTYVILPNQHPPGRFEAHLEVLSGSANELERQQGMAHLLEHVAYMGSPKRQLISGTGSRTNAYTDFHHTVFFASCPVQTPDQFWKKPMLPMALDALLDVMTTNIDEDRLEKERAAVLSEASMVNKMEYRVECQILSSLHAENRISTRFPIGKENLIKQWTKEDLQLYHNLHYRPDNVILFVVGDVEVNSAIDTIKQKFGHLQPKIDAQQIFDESGEFPALSMRNAWRHFPPVIHKWSCAEEKLENLLPPALIKPQELVGSAPPAPSPEHTSRKEVIKQEVLLPATKVFHHELLQSFSFHLFAKRPIEHITTKEALKREIMRRMTLSALQIRLNVMERQEPLFTFADFNQLGWPREGCAVCSFDMTTDIDHWKEAVQLAVKEIRRLGLYGLTGSELARYKQASLAEAAQIAAQCDQKSSEDILQEVMEAEASGHTYMHPVQRYEVIEQVLQDITLDEVKEVARDLCEHLSHVDTTVKPSALVACSPLVTRGGQSFSVTEEEVAEVVAQALIEDVEPLQDTPVPATLLDDEQMEEKLRRTQPRFIPLEGKAQKEYKSKNSLNVVQRRLSNGVKVNLHTLPTESQKAHVRMLVPGGRLTEKKSELGSILLGCRTMQEGGAFLDMTREEVELFCIDHLVMVEITANEESIIFDFQTVTTPGPGGKVTGIEASMQVAHIILTDFKFENDAFVRAQQAYHEQFDSIVKGLESACMESLLYSLTGGDGRLLTPNHHQVDGLSLDICKQAVRDQLRPDNVEVTISGDLTIAEQEQLVLKYLGTVPHPTHPTTHPMSPPIVSHAVEKQSLSVHTLGGRQQLGVYLPDSDERAMGYLAGPAPNKYGVLSDGRNLADELVQASGGKKEGRWEHPLFASAAMQIVQEVANRRLFSVVREERQLTYDASFSFHPLEACQGSYYTVSVTSSPATVQQAVRACMEALGSLQGPFGILGDSVTSAKRTLINKHRLERTTNRYYIDNLSGTQLDHIPAKSWKNILDYETVLGSVTVQDVQLLVKLLQWEPEKMTACVGIAAPQPPAGMKSAKAVASEAKVI